MKRKTISLLVAIFLSLGSLMAQEPEFVLGDQVINAGIGFGSTLYTGGYNSTTVPPISISYEKAIVDEILEKGVVGIGGYLGYSSWKYEYSGWGWKYSDIILAARGSFHYPLVDKLDTYTGLLLGYEIVTDKSFGDPLYDYSSSYGGLTASWFLGGRYYFNEQFSAMAELGYGIAYLTLGVGIKL